MILCYPTSLLKLKFMSLKNSKILLTIYLGGRLGAPQPGKHGKEVLSKIKSSPYEVAILDAKKVPTGKYFTPKGHYKAPNNFTPREELECKKITMLCEECVNFFISMDSCPHRVKKTVWEKLSEEERLKINLEITADGSEYSYEVIE